jgi:hypothetical protein
MIVHPASNLSKEERRMVFAAQVAREEEEEKNRQMQDHMVVLHQERCANLGLDAATVPILDPTCTYYLEPTTVTWREIDLNGIFESNANGSLLNEDEIDAYF